LQICWTTAAAAAIANDDAVINNINDLTHILSDTQNNANNIRYLTVFYSTNYG